MKKEWILLVLLAFMNLTAFCQFRIGVKAGINYTNVIKSDDADTKIQNHFKPGFHFGAHLQIPLTPDFYIFSGLLYSTKGASDYNQLKDLTLWVSYLELPVDMAYKFVTGGGSVNAGLGLYFAYALAGNIEYAGGKEDLKFTNNLTEDDPFARKPYDIGTEAFIGYDFNFGLTFQIKAQLGLINLMPYIDGDSNQITDKNYGVAVSAGYKF